MTEPSSDEPDKPWKWPAKWVIEEKFWQDVTTRTLAAIIVISLGYTGAVLGGYLSGPTQNLVTGLFTLIFVMITLYLSIEIPAMYLLGKHRLHGPPREQQCREHRKIAVASLVILLVALPLDVLLAKFITSNAFFK